MTNPSKAVVREGVTVYQATWGMMPVEAQERLRADLQKIAQQRRRPLRRK